MFLLVGLAIMWSTPRAIDAFRIKDSAILASEIARNSELLAIRDSAGRTLLHRAAGLGNMSLVKLLVESGADVEAEASDGITPLFEACYGLGKKPIVEYLLDHGASVISRDSTRTSLHSASIWHSILSNRSLPGTKGIIAVFGDRRYRRQVQDAEDVLLLLRRAGAAMDAKDQFGKSPMHYLEYFEARPQLVKRLRSTRQRSKGEFGARELE